MRVLSKRNFQSGRPRCTPNRRKKQFRTLLVYLFLVVNNFVSIQSIDRQSPVRFAGSGNVRSSENSRENPGIICFPHNYTNYAEKNYSNGGSGGKKKWKQWLRRWKTSCERINSRGPSCSRVICLYSPTVPVLSQKHLSIVWKCTKLRFTLRTFSFRRDISCV